MNLTVENKREVWSGHNVLLNEYDEWCESPEYSTLALYVRIKKLYIAGPPLIEVIPVPLQ